MSHVFAYIIEKYDVNKDREHEKLYSIHFSGREGCQVALCLKKKICEENKMANLYEEIHYPLGEASDRMVTVSVFQSRVKLHIRQFYRDYYYKLRAGQNGITISAEEFREFTKLNPKLQQDVLNNFFKLLEDEKPEVIFPGDLDVTIIPPPPSPPTSVVDTDVNHEMLTPQWKENEIINATPVQLEGDTQPQSSKTEEQG